MGRQVFKHIFNNEEEENVDPKDLVSDVAEEDYEEESLKFGEHPLPWIWIHDVDENTPKQVLNEIKKLDAKNIQLVVIAISSLGGLVYSGLEIYDIIEAYKKRGMTFATIAMGKAMSCGAFLLSCGTKGFRFASDNCSIMIHEAAGFSFGKFSDMKTDVDHIEFLNNQMFKIMAENCGKDFEEFKKEYVGRTDQYITSVRAKEIGLIDQIGIPHTNLIVQPDIKVSFTADIKLEEEESKPEPTEEKPKPKPRKRTTKKE